MRKAANAKQEEEKKRKDKQVEEQKRAKMVSGPANFFQANLGCQEQHLAIKSVPI